LPCLIRRAALRGTEGTTYTLSDLTTRDLDACEAQGQQVRSFQFAIERIRQKPELARFLIHKPGPLSDESPARQAALRRGLQTRPRRDCHVADRRNDRSELILDETWARCFHCHLDLFPDPVAAVR
jgi:hypothetical protein